MADELTAITNSYNQNGYYFPIDAMSVEQALVYRSQFEAAEREYKDKDPDFDALVFGHANMVMPFIDEITRLSSVLDPVRAILGTDVMVWGANLFIKEAYSPNYVSWHQDLTYWGLDGVDKVTAWVALSSATVRSGCMRYVPGTHTREIVPHRDTFAENNQLSRGQEVAVDVNEAEAAMWSSHLVKSHCIMGEYFMHRRQTRQTIDASGLRFVISVHGCSRYRGLRLIARWYRERTATAIFTSLRRHAE